MKSVARWSIDNRVPVNIIMVMLIVGGILAFRGTHREVFPLFDTKLVIVTTPYFGVAPAELEQLVTIPIENAVAEVPDVKEIRSTTTEGLSTVLVEFEEYIESVTLAAQDVGSAIDKITAFPQDAEETQVRAANIGWPVIDVAVTGAASEEDRREAAKLLKRRLERIDGVATVRAVGLREREIWVELDPNSLYGLNVSLDLVLTRLRQRLVNVPAGSLQTEGGEILLRTTGTTARAENIASVAIRAGSGAATIRLSNLGVVNATFEEAVTMARANGQPSITLGVTKQRNGDTIRIAEAVRELVDELRPALADGVEIVLLNDSSVEISSRLQTMYQSGIWGLALVLLVLNIFLNPRVAAMTAFGLPLAVAGGLIVLGVTGGSLNILSLFAFILVLGILVDDAIVIAENSYRYMQRGMEPKEATIRGAREVTIPVVAGVSTTIAAFVPLLLTEGRMGQVLVIVPVVAIACLVASLLEALVILPSHLADFSRPAAAAKEARRNPLWFRRMRLMYGHLVAGAVRYRYATLALVLAAAATAGAVATQMKFIFMDDSDAVEFSIEIRGSASSSLQDTSLLVQQAERILLEFPATEIESTMSSIGQTTDRRGSGRSDRGPHVGEITIKAADRLVRERSGAEIFQDLRERVQRGVVGAESLEFSRQAMGPPSGRAIYVQVLGEDIDTLRQISDEMQRYLASINGVFDITDSFLEGKDEVRVEIDEARAALYGLSVDNIGRTVRTAMAGTVVATVQEGDEDIDVRVRYLPQYRRTIDDIASLRIPTAAGDLVPFGNVASLRRIKGLGQIDRVDRERVIAVSADVDSNVITSVEANALVAAQFPDIGERYPGYHLVFGGEAQDTLESLQSLFRAFIVALLIMYTILGAIFKSFTQPFVVLFAIPFSLIGVVAGFFVLDKPLTFMALFGVIALGGIVVNDSLLLVHFINEARARGTDRVYAIAISAKRRFRPVMLTTLSTVAGLFPLTLVDNEAAAWMAPMALAIVCGLSFSTIMVLLLVPALYMINDDLRRGARALFGGRKKPDSASAPFDSAAPALPPETG